MPASRHLFDPSRDEAVSEVVGQILMFGILSMVLILSLFSFNIAKRSAEERVLETTADSVAQRVASLVIETALFAESFQDQNVSLESRLDLPARLEGRQYSIEMDGTTITLNAGDAVATSPLFSAGSEGLVHVCEQEAIDGGDVVVGITPDSDPGDGDADMPVACTGAPPEAQFYITLEIP